MLGTIAFFLILLVGLRVVPRLVDRVFPALAMVALTPQEVQEIKQEYRFRWILLNISALIAAVIAGFVGLLLLRLIAAIRNNLMPPHLQILDPAPFAIYWAVPCLFFGLISAIVFFQFWARLKFGDELFVRVYSAFEQATLPFLKWLITAVYVVLAIWIPLGMCWYTRLEVDRIVINRVLALGEQSYPYAEISRLITTKSPSHNNGIEQTNHYVIFNDGTQWKLGEGHEDYDRAMATLSRQSNKPIEHAKSPKDAVGK